MVVHISSVAASALRGVELAMEVECARFAATDEELFQAGRNIVDDDDES